MGYANFPDPEAVAAVEAIDAKSETPTCTRRDGNCRRRKLAGSAPAGRQPGSNGSATVSQTISVDIYARVLPVPNITVAALWERLASRLRVLTAGEGLQMDIAFQNATIETLVRGRKLPVVSQEFLPREFEANRIARLPSNDSGIASLPPNDSACASLTPKVLPALTTND